jgi:hypothetical protein
MKYVNYRTINKDDAGPGDRPELYRNKQYSNKGDIMNEQQQIEARLWDYIDGLGSAEEKSAVEQLIAADKEWQTMHRELLEAHQLLNASELEVPSLRFTKNVMDEIARHHVAPATRTYVNKNIIRGVGAFLGLMMVGFLVFVLGQFHSSGYHSDTPVYNPDLTLLSQYGKSLESDLNKLNWNRVFNNTYVNIFILINMILGFMLLDMYLHRRKEKASHQQA